MLVKRGPWRLHIIVSLELVSSGSGYGWSCTAILTPFFDILGIEHDILGETFSHLPTPKRSFGVLKLPILTEFDLFGPKFHFSLDLFVFSGQWHTPIISDGVPSTLPFNTWSRGQNGSKQYFILYFIEWKSCYFDSNFTEVFPNGARNKCVTRPYCLIAPSHYLVQCWVTDHIGEYAIRHYLSQC